MSFKLKISIFLSIMLLALSGCNIAQVYNVPHQSIVTDKADKQVTDKDIYKSIVRAGAGLGWIVKRVKPGIAEASLHLRSHIAIVTIEYNKNDYSITYKESTDLRYDPTAKTIHSNYNGWIQNLNRAIQVQLSLI